MKPDRTVPYLTSGPHMRINYFLPWPQTVSRVHVTTSLITMINNYFLYITQTLEVIGEPGLPMLSGLKPLL